MRNFQGRHTRYDIRRGITCFGRNPKGEEAKKARKQERENKPQSSKKEERNNLGVYPTLSKKEEKQKGSKKKKFAGHIKRSPKKSSSTI
jgi:hypothetical protein